MNHPESLLETSASSSDVPTDASILTPSDLEQQAESIETGDAMIFETSGTQGHIKQIPYANSQLEDQKRYEARAFKMAGLRPDDVVMTLGAPLKGISGWASRSGSRKLGAEVLNRSFNDYEKVIDWREANDVTAIFATPLVAKSIGEKIAAEYGPPDRVFPNMRLGFLFGDLLPDHLRASLKNQWGFEELRSLYGSVEADVIAIAVDSTQELVPMIDKLTIEIIPESNENSTPVDIRDVTTEMIGPVLISDPSRDLFPFSRYRIGDIVRVTPGEIPRLRVMGREDNTINLGGAPLYEQQLHTAMVETYGQEIDDWGVVVSRPDIRPAIDVYVVTDKEQISEDKFRKCLFNHSPPVREAYNDVGNGIIEYIQIHKIPSLETVTHEFNPDDINRDIKSNRIVFEDSYFE
jgi:phenylacetate-coenzyme A ligase PaaK-like adenylate-forming protein